MSRFQLPSPPPLDADGLVRSLDQAWSSAGLDPSSGPLRGVGETIRRALQSAGLSGPGGQAPGEVIDVVARELDPDGAPAGAAEPPPARREGPTAPGAFSSHALGAGPGAGLAYKLYRPAAAPAGPRPLLVLLHGCTQSADDFAAGTRMNQLAEAHGLLVAYPEQSAQANPSRCWNWFQPGDQRRGRGEPAAIAAMVAEIAARDGVDEGRVFAAGLSAGAAMAVVLGQAYPELFAAVGGHSGLPYASAVDVPSALAAMKGGPSGKVGRKPLPGAVVGRRPLDHAVPTIVFHGDRDHTVHASNAEAQLQQALEAHGRSGAAPLAAQRTAGAVPGGRRFTRVAHVDADGVPRLESWTLHGAGHAWSGGDARGSYTDPTGPDASAEMLRFFLAQRG